MFLFIKVLTLLKLAPSERSLPCFNNCVTPCICHHFFSSDPFQKEETHHHHSLQIRHLNKVNQLVIATEKTINSLDNSWNYFSKLQKELNKWPISLLCYLESVNIFWPKSMSIKLHYVLIPRFWKFIKSFNYDILSTITFFFF